MMTVLASLAPILAAAGDAAANAAGTAANAAANAAAGAAPLDPSLVAWSRAQFALTAMFHWCFVPLTLGLGVIMSVMETLYVRTGDARWRRTARFWQKCFGINFAVGVATGIILEFEFGTNWSNYSWFVGDIFGAPLAIEGIFAFFMEATFISVMFFGWERVSRRFHLAATWLTTAGATLSALWILVANAWMQHPAGMVFNPDTARCEMTDFWAVLTAFSLTKFAHTVASSWLVGAAFVVTVAAWYLLKRRETRFALDSVRVAAAVGAAGLLLTLHSGDKSAYQVAALQPMKFAAMEGLYDGGAGMEITAVGIVNPDKKYDDDQQALWFKIGIPKVLSLLATHSLDGHVPGIRDIIAGDYELAPAHRVAGDAATAAGATAPLPAGSKALPVAEKIRRGRLALAALADYRKAAAAGTAGGTGTAKEAAAARLREHLPHLGYGFLRSPEEAIPPVALTFYSFRVMVALGVYFIALFALLLWLTRNEHCRCRLTGNRRLQWLCVFSAPLAYLCSQAGWVVAEVGRQPWAIQDILPVTAAVSNLETGHVRATFCVFLAFFTVLLAAELRIMLKQIQTGPEPETEA